MTSTAQLEDELTRPSAADIAFLRHLEGDVMILGAGGKMGPSLARLAQRAVAESGSKARIIAVTRSEPGTVHCDLLDRDQVARLPDCRNVLFLAGRKFGSVGNMPLTWATNTIVPSYVAERFRHSRIVVLSSGNVYPFTAVPPNELTPPAPLGEYAQSVLGRERVFEYFSERHGTPVAIIRLNYAVDLRYGVLLDIGQRVWRRLPVSLAMGRVNVIWQGDANSAILRSPALASSPPRILNLAGPEILRVRFIAQRFAEIFGIEPQFEGSEAETALLSDASQCRRLLGSPSVTADELIRRQADWIRAGLPTLDKPTHFEVRDGAF